MFRVSLDRDRYWLSGESEPHSAVGSIEKLPEKSARLQPFGKIFLENLVHNIREFGLERLF